MSSLKIDPLPLEGAALVRWHPFRDTRGTFARLYCETELRPLLGARRITTANFSQTDHVGTVRGLHYQRPPASEMKFVRCLAGRVFDVIVDLRADSRTFLHWIGVELTPDDFGMLVIPEGFAHGFQALDAPATLLYLHTAPHAPESEAGLAVTDPKLGIVWPRPITLLSDRDAGFPPLGDRFEGLAP